MNYQPTVIQKYRKKKEAQAKKEREIMEHNQRMKREVIGVLLLTPAVLIALYILFVVIWTITPQSWW